MVEEMEVDMSLTISLNPATLTVLSEEASARNTTCEQVVCEMIEAYFHKPTSPTPEYDAWFKAKYEEGKAAYARGDFRTNEEVEREAQLRRAKLKARIASVQ